ncbi:MAG: hypothetical protein M1820_007131 [Bogoriella megaspora]|nr:MAG: hypothetical protein M1820_007131 [Bogoriella megaspora]
MSDSPAKTPSGPTPNGTAQPAARINKKRKHNPLVSASRSSSKPLPRPGQAGSRLNGGPQAGPSATSNNIPQRGTPGAQRLPISTKTPQTSTSAGSQETGEKDLGPPNHEFKLVTTKRELMNSIRYHAMRLQSKDTEDLYDENQFTRPINLHRRNPHYHPGDHLQDGDAEDEEDEVESKLDEERRAQKKATREANQALIAPNLKENSKKKDFQKKTQQVYSSYDDAAAKKRSQLRYEETMPWHLEDGSEKQVWIGHYEKAMSESFVMLVPGSNHDFRVVPLEKWYRFRPRATNKILSAEEAEERMNKGISEPRLVREARLKAIEEKKKSRTVPQKMILRRGERGERPGQGRDDDEGMDVVGDENEIDFNTKEEFQDDEENALFDDEEIEKEAERKIEKEQKEANSFAGVKEEKDWDAEEEKLKKEREERRKREKATRKAFKREQYATTLLDELDSDDDPYSDSSDSSQIDNGSAHPDGDSNQNKEVDTTDKSKATADGSKPASARGSGTNTPKSGSTPSGRASKHPPAPDRLASSSNLKRPGSPNLSETDGTESTRKMKKQKKQHDKPSQALSISASAPATAPSSRPMSPDPGTDIESRKRKVGAGSGSDTDTDSRKRLKIRVGGQKSPVTSRAGSPAAPNSATGTGSRAGSPGAIVPAATTPATAAPTPKPKPPAATFPTEAEIVSAVPAQGIALNELANLFKKRVGSRSQDFIRIVKTSLKYVKPDKAPAMLYQKKPAAETDKTVATAAATSPK